MGVRLLNGTEARLECAMEAMKAIPVDESRPVPDEALPRRRFQTTLAHSFSVTGQGTYCHQSPATLEFMPSAQSGWWFERTDLPGQPPIRVSPGSILSANRNLTLQAGAADNFVRMTEHIIAQRLGLRLDNVVVKMQSYDPPLFDDGSMPIAKGIVQAGVVEDETLPLSYFSVKEPVAIMNERGGFLLFEPPAEQENVARLTLDVAVDFPNAIGRQRIVFDLTDEAFTHGAMARTNASFKDYILMKTLGKFSAFWRNTGYNRKNILVAGKKDYWNTPGLMHDGKSLEAVWHRACEDLLAALSLWESGRLMGRITSYKAGHQLDVDFMTALAKQGLLVEC